MPRAARQPDPGPDPVPPPGKDPFDIDLVFGLLREATAGLPKAAMFELRDRGHGTPFEQLVSALISARTRDEVSLPVSLRLFAVANTPGAMAALPEERIVELIHGATFPEPKARDIKELSRRIAEEHGGRTPDTLEGLTAFRGVGPKIAGLALGIGYGLPVIAVDIHVHRVTNRWGYVATKTPEATLAALEAILPRTYRVEINERLVPFGKHICTGVAPRCSTCPLLRQCQQVGVTDHE
ncbi:endonuclease III [Aerophototrophica crusticola]|uniref:Endonuclease III n=1 Tax=Aerophototrophica crusticola TaxID=1709002 RepID=A0A858R2Z4_9PROT|nr:endonuclease III [Rhodospirillaceae bacterium B3]